MSKSDLARAHDLIARKHYDEARVLLQSIDDPAAKYWLLKLNAKAPPPKPQRSYRPLMLTGLFVLVGIVGVLLVATLNTQRQAAELQMQVINGTIQGETESFLETSTMVLAEATYYAALETQAVMTQTEVTILNETVDAQLQASIAARRMNNDASLTAIFATADFLATQLPAFGQDFCSELGTPFEQCRYYRP
jgi:hypothetical protein